MCLPNQTTRISHACTRFTLLFHVPTACHAHRERPLCPVSVCYMPHPSTWCLLPAPLRFCYVSQIDAIGTKRFDSQTGADREVQRILLELLNQMDGFDQSVNVKVIMATNRMDTLDPALMRPGRLDRKVTRASMPVVIECTW